jgi:hypothetical protein
MLQAPVAEVLAASAQFADDGAVPIFGTLINATTRVSGAEAIWWLGNMQPHGWRWDLVGDMLRERALTRAYTWNVVGVMTDADWRPPTFLGAFLLIGGAAAVPWMTAAATATAETAYRWCRRLDIAPVAGALLGTFLFIYLSEGNFGIRDPIGLAITIFLTTLQYRWLLSGRFLRDLSGGRRTTTSITPGL